MQWKAQLWVPKLLVWFQKKNKGEGIKKSLSLNVCIEFQRSGVDSALFCNPFIIASNMRWSQGPFLTCSAAQLPWRDRAQVVQSRFWDSERLS